jgi:hypothetical protein
MYQSDEIQRLTCTGTKGYFYLIFRRAKTVLIKFDDTIDTLKKKLEQIATIEEVSISLPNKEVHTTPICSATGTTFDVMFFTPHGDLPPLEFDLSQGVTSLTVTEIQKGTKESIECSGRGVCDPTSGDAGGTCICFDGFASSDGKGGAGPRSDCGWPKVFSGPISETHAHLPSALTAGTRDAARAYTGSFGTLRGTAAGNGGLARAESSLRAGQRSAQSRATALERKAVELDRMRVFDEFAAQ